MRLIATVYEDGGRAVVLRDAPLTPETVDLVFDAWKIVHADEMRADRESKSS